MAFHRLANLMFAAQDTNKCIAAPPAHEIKEAVTAWITEGKQTPADWDWRSKVGKSPISFLINYFDPSFIELLEELSQDESKDESEINYIKKLRIAFTVQGLTEVQQARIIQFFNIDLQQYPPGQSNDFQSCLLHYLAQSRFNLQPHLLNCFVKAGLIDKTDSLDMTPLMRAIEKRRYANVLTLHACGANLYLKDTFGSSPQQQLHQILRDKLVLLQSVDVNVDQKQVAQVTTEQFNQAVYQFLQQHDVDLQTVFDPHDDRYPLFQDLFLTNPVISAFLMRNQVQMGANNIPEYTALEQQLYILMHQVIESKTKSAICEIPYRTSRDTMDHNIQKRCYERFYDSGTMPEDTSERVKQLRHQIGANQPVYLMHMTDVFETAEAIERMSKSTNLRANALGFSFVVSATSRDAHITAMLSVINVNEHRVRYHILLNTTKADGYAEHLNFRIQKEIQKQNFCNGYHAPMMLDASFHIQLEDDDRNCGLYTIAICEGLIEALQTDAVLQQRLTNLKLQTKEKQVIKFAWGPDFEYFPTQLEDEKQWEPVSDYLQQSIMHCTPLLFELAPDGVSYVNRPYVQLKMNFCQVRWQVGNLIFGQNVANKREQLALLKQQFTALLTAADLTWADISEQLDKYHRCKPTYRSLMQALLPFCASAGRSSTVARIETFQHQHQPAVLQTPLTAVQQQQLTFILEGYSRCCLWGKPDHQLNSNTEFLIDSLQEKMSSSL